MRYVEHRIPSDTGINKDGDIDARAFGSMVHTGLALHWEGASPDALFKSFTPVTVRERCAVAMVSRYAETYPHDLEQYAVEAIEAQFDTERYKGQVDGIIIDKATGERMLLEHKTALVINDEAFATYRDKLAMDLQIRLYCHAVGVKKVLYDVLKKPYIRRRKAETDDEFVQRYADGCTFTRFVIDLTADDIADAMADADAVYTAVEAGRFCKSRNNCNMGFKCDYFDLCAGKKTIDDYTLKDANCMEFEKWYEESSQAQRRRKKIAECQDKLTELRSQERDAREQYMRERELITRRDVLIFMLEDLDNMVGDVAAQED
ncbi:unnamed protein product [Cylicocyclus nassatus]|uniref:PD-(D/E)XK endonuclease-like domain-containing protein n=1 Tax=Cylicocyclus nassatus TaxID=53992 RepID=A0AA36HJ06_CYLNA|nr:unnamed protein product [Cylicocyclus nassatus]